MLVCVFLRNLKECWAIMSFYFELKNEYFIIPVRRYLMIFTSCYQWPQFWCNRIQKLCLSQFFFLRYSCTVGKYLDNSFGGHWFSNAISVVHWKKHKTNKTKEEEIKEIVQVSVVWFEYCVGLILNRQCRQLNNLETVTTECLWDSRPPCHKMLPSENLFLCDLGYLFKASCWFFFFSSEFYLAWNKPTSKFINQPHREFCNWKLVLEHPQHEVRRQLATVSRGQPEERQDSCLDTPQHRCKIRTTNGGTVRYYIPVLDWFLYCLLGFYFFPSVWRT